MKKTLNVLRRIIKWPVALVNNTVACVTGICTPREFLCYSFNYVPEAFLNQKGHGKFRVWFDCTDFGWYWKSSNYLNNRKIKQSKFLQILLRFRWIFIVPSEFIYCLVESPFDKEWKVVTKAHIRYIFKVLKDGNYDSREDY